MWEAVAFARFRDRARRTKPATTVQRMSAGVWAFVKPAASQPVMLATRTATFGRVIMDLAVRVGK